MAVTQVQPVFPSRPKMSINTIPHSPNDAKTLILKRCKTTRDLNQVHAHLIKTRLHFNSTVIENLLESAAILLPTTTATTTMDYALSIFRQIEEPQSSAYNVIIRGFTYKQSHHEALTLFKTMIENSTQPDKFTFSSTLKACSRLKALTEGKQIHAQVLKSGYGSNGFAGNSLIHMYANCEELEVARKVFDEMSEKDNVSWNAMFTGYSKNGLWEDVVGLFREMMKLGVAFDEVCLIIVATACGRLADIELGEWIHEYIETGRVKKSIALTTALIDMYAKCGKLDVSRKLFDEMDRKDVVTWSAMISGYNQARRCKEALEVFHLMQMENAEPNEVTLVSVLSSCAILGALETGKWVHFFTKKKKMKLTVTLGTALMDFYMKCGLIDDAIHIFDQIPFKNVFSWTVLIQGLASNGRGKEALEYFHTMQEKDVKPNDVTFIGVLTACSHAGLVEKGRDFFVSMSRDFGIEPRMEHYGCMVDILGRAGLIEEAYQFIKNMHLQPNAVIWRTLLASCKAHRNVKIGEESVEQIVKLTPLHSGDYILLSNLYASVGRLDDAKKVRNRVKQTGIEKIPGCTLIELDGEIHEFISGDRTHIESNEIYRAIDDVLRRIKSAGYVPNTAEARLDAEEDGDKEAALSHHSEKLAIAFGLIKTGPGTTIRISKNLRVCKDCHNATKMISKVYDREIVVRDRNRFHHFKHGVCSCNDYW